MRVSVIVLTYNRVDYLKEALRCILEQTRPAFEVLVVDAGSTDGTEAYVRQIGPPVQYHNLNIRGISEARNYGLALAGGELIAWLDSDDLWEPHYLEATLDALAHDHALDGVYTGLTFIDGQGHPVRSVTPTEPPDRLYETLVEDNFLPVTSVVMWKRCYDAVGEFDPQFGVAEDYDMWLRITRRFRIGGIPQILASYRVHSGNTVKNLEALTESRLTMTAKHFGELADEAEQNPPERRRAFAFAYRRATLYAVESGKPDLAARYLRRAVELYPPLLERLDTYYELALIDQPLGQRGLVKGLDMRTRGDVLVARIALLLEQTPGISPTLRRTAWGKTYLALGMLADQAGDWSLARSYMMRAASADPAMVRDPSFVRRLAKLAAGKRLTGLARR
jgi:glycosyltransferase involved in cell wall biosynthesis